MVGTSTLDWLSWNHLDRKDIVSDLARRAVGGVRVGALFTMDIYNHTKSEGEESGYFEGILVFNVRGGCFFIKDGLKQKAKSRIFWNGETANIPVMELTLDGKTVGTFKNFKVKLLREKKKNSDCGLIVKFLHLSDNEIGILNSLVEVLPPVYSDPIKTLDDKTLDNKSQDNKSQDDRAA